VPAWNLYRRFNLWRWFNSFLPMQVAVARGLERVLTISQASTRDIIADFGIESSRCRMVSNGINLEVFQPKPEIAREPDRLITTLSADVPLKAFPISSGPRRARKERPDLELTVIGSRRIRGTADLIRHLGLGRPSLYRRVQDVEIARRYTLDRRSPSCLVAIRRLQFPAGGERYGVRDCARLDPWRRAAGGRGRGSDTGVLVEPGSVRALAGIRALLDAAPTHARAWADGPGRASSNFTWRRTASRRGVPRADCRARTRAAMGARPTWSRRPRGVAGRGRGGKPQQISRGAPAAQGRAAASALSEAIAGADDRA
jgi:hypothetical protein